MNIIKTGVAFSVIAISACGSSNDGGPSAQDFLKALQGTWAQSCAVNDDGSSFSIASIYDGRVAYHDKQFASDDCSGPLTDSFYGLEKLTAVKEITTASGTKAWQVNFTVKESPDADDIDQTFYELLAIIDGKLHFGAEESDTTGNTAASRATDLDYDYSLTRVVKADDLVGFLGMVKGGWGSGCNDYGDGTSDQSSVTFSGLTDDYVGSEFSNADCSGTADVNYFGTDLFIVGPSVTAPAGVTAFEVDFVAIDSDDANAIGEVYYTAIGVDANHIYLGTETDANSGDTAGSRASTLDMDNPWSRN